MTNNQSKINYKTVPISVQALDGSRIYGVISYWAKDYTIHMTAPFQTKGCGGDEGHLQFAIPATYVTDESKRKGVVQINLLERTEKYLLSQYDEWKNQRNEGV